MGTIILSTNCQHHNSKDKAPEIIYGFESRLLTSRLPMNCSENYLAIYDESKAFRFKENEYSLMIPNNKIGQEKFLFEIIVSKLDEVDFYENPRISFCKDGIEYIGRGNPVRSSSMPPACHFYFNLSEQGNIIISDSNTIACRSIEYISIEEFRRRLRYENN